MGKNIIIRESHLEKIVNKLLTEKMGVPEGIIDSAKLIYSQVVDILGSEKQNKTLGLKDHQATVEYDLTGDYRISDSEFDSLSFLFNYDEISDNMKDQAPIVASMAYRQINQKDFKTFTILTIDTNGELRFSIDIAVTTENTFGDIYNLFVRDKEVMISSLAHELKHSYDFLKKDRIPMVSFAKYITVSNTRFNIKAFDDLLFNLYFIHDVESLVRNTEIATLMDLNDVDKENFESFLGDQKIYKTLQKIKNFTYSGLRTELLNDIDNVREVFDNNGIDLPTDDDQAIDMALELIYKTLVDKQGSKYHSMLSSSVFEDLFGLSDEKQMEVERFVQQLTRFRSYEDFYKYLEKDFQKTGTNVLKKITKLYDMAKDTEKSKSTDLMRKITSKGETTESIIDWDLHQQLMEKKYGKTKIKTKFDFK